MGKKGVLALTILCTILGPAIPGTALPPPTDILINGDFEAGSPITVDTSREPLAFVIKQVGSVLPGETENRTQLAAAAWTLRVFSGDRSPHSLVRWGAGIGVGHPVVHNEAPEPLDTYTKSSALEFRMDERDRGAEVLVLEQALGQDPHLGIYSNPSLLAVDARSAFGHEVTIRAAVATVEDRWHLTYTEPVIVDQESYQTEFLRFPEGTGTPTRFFLFLETEVGSGQDTAFYLDNLQLRAEAIEPKSDLSEGIVEPWLREVCRLTGVCL